MTEKLERWSYDKLGRAHFKSDTGRFCIASEAFAIIDKLTAERDEWGRRWQELRQEKAEAQYPGRTGIIKAHSEDATK